MKTIVLSPDGNTNFTPKVIEALNEIKEGGELRFEKGEYHFYEEGTFQKFFAVTNNTNCVRKVAFPIIGMKNVTIDGGDSLFVFHRDTSSFVVSHSENITIKNFTRTMDHLPYVLMKVGKIDDNGFELIMHPEVDYTVNENGSIAIKTMLYNMSTANGNCFSLHSLDRINIKYLFAGPDEPKIAGLAAPHYETIAEPIEGGVYCRYTNVDESIRAIKCAFCEGENIGIISEGRRRTIIFMEESSEINISNILVKRGTGMGVVAQCCHNINVDGFNVIPDEGDPCPLTADALHFVHCTGLVDARNCDIRNIMDDIFNVHGMYSTVDEVLENGIKIKIHHFEQAMFLPYHEDDKLSVIDPATLEIKGTITSKDYEYLDEKGLSAVVRIKDPEKLSFVKVGDLIEDPDRMPAFNFVGNKGINIPTIRFAGNKRAYMADNYFSGFYRAVNANDMPDYWYESGRLGEVIIENNTFDARWKFEKEALFSIGVRGFAPGKAPKVHEKIIIRNNKYLNIKNKDVYDLNGVKEFIEENNVWVDDTEK